MKFTTTLLAVLSASTTAVSLLISRDVYAPKVTYPKKGTVWYSGQRHNVTWDASNPPIQITNPIGQIYLRKNGLTQMDRPLASDFLLVDGRVELTVPNVACGEYELVLMGDSGNFSPLFAIIKRED